MFAPARLLFSFWAPITCGAVSLALCGCVPAYTPSGAELRHAYAAEYAFDSGTNVLFEADPDSAIGAAVLYESQGFVPATAEHPGMSEMLGYPLIDCSSATARCIFFSGSVFAVPAAGLSGKVMFDAGGASLTVLGCPLMSGKSCATAVIKSECRWYLESEGSDGRPISTGCIADSHKPDGAQGGVTTIYLLDASRGVVWWNDSAACVAKPLSSDCLGEGSARLKTEAGLLANSR